MKPEEITTWESFLKRTPLFSGLSAEDLGKLAARLQLLSLPKGATLFKQGDESDALYLIVSGHARRYRGPEDQEALVAYLGRGDVVGETGLLTSAPRSSACGSARGIFPACRFRAWRTSPRVSDRASAFPEAQVRALV